MAPSPLPNFLGIGVAPFLAACWRLGVLFSSSFVARLSRAGCSHSLAHDGCAPLVAVSGPTWPGLPAVVPRSQSMPWRLRPSSQTLCCRPAASSPRRPCGRRFPSVSHLPSPGLAPGPQRLSLLPKASCRGPGRDQRGGRSETR